MRFSPWVIVRALHLSGGVFCLLLSSEAIHAQDTSISSSGLGTTISPARLENGQTVHDIIGGARTGTNLFHSFGAFSVGENNSANFLNDGSSINNILSRVTGGSASNIFGEIRTTGFGAANLYLINPSGVVFGPNASIDVGGSFHTSTADFLRLQDNIKFNATPRPEDALLTSAPVAAFGFLEGDQASIQANESTLEVSSGKAISLVSGDIKIVNGILRAPGGKINLASVDSAGEVAIDSLTSTVSVDADKFASLGSISLRGILFDDFFSPIPNIDVGTPLNQTTASGSVFIFGGETVIDGSRVSAVNSGEGNSGNITLDVQRLSLRNGAEINTSTTGKGAGGDIRITAIKRATIAGTSVDPFGLPLPTRVTSATSGSGGDAGKITITTPTSDVEDGALIQATSSGEGDAGDIGLNVETLSVTGGARIFNRTTNEGASGTVRIRAPNGVGAARMVSVTGQDILGITPSSIESLTTGIQKGGDIDIKSQVLQVSDGALLSAESTGQATGDGGNVIVEVSELLVSDNGEITASTSGDGKGGIVDINAMNLMLDNGRITTSTTGSKDAGTVSITANNMSLTHDARIESTTSTTGDAGDVTILAKEGGALNLSVSGGAQITASTSGSGGGGNVSVTANGGEVTFAGVGADGTPSAITTESVANAQNNGVAGNAGTIMIKAGRFVVRDGGEVSASTSTMGAGGDLDVTADSVLVDGPRSQISASVSETGKGMGGNVDIRASNIDLINGGQISARSDSDDANAKSGNVTVRFDDTFRIFNKSSVNVTTAVADAGDININPKPDSPKGSLLHLRDNSSISTSAGGGAGNGGNINIDPVFVVLDGRSRIVAEANRGSGGKISITTDFLFQSPDSMISAASGIPELSGTVEIDSPDSDVISGTLMLSESFLSASTLLGSRCAARAAKESSSFVVGGRGGVPVAPDAVFSGPISDLGCP